MGNPDQARYGIDRLTATGKRIFGWGWVAHEVATPRDVHLRIEGHGWQRRLKADIGLARDDVAQALPSLRNGASSGFILTGYVPDTGAQRYVLEAEFDDGSVIELDASAAVQVPEESPRRWRQLGYLARAVWRRISRGDFAGIVRRARAQRFAAASLDDRAVDALIPVLRGYPKAWLVFDHNMGGGANQYRRNLIAERLAAGEAVVFCTYNLPMLEYRVHVLEPHKPEAVFRVSSFLALEAMIEALDVIELFVNSPVSFDDPTMLAEWLVRVRARHPGSRLVVTTHDYFAVCPSFVLLDAQGRHCGIPAEADCARCLKAHEASYVSLSPPTEIAAWRASWGRCLAAADEVRCFSRASLDLLMKAYPALGPERVTLLPHKVDFVPARIPRLDASAPLVIGVVGEISPQKGAHIVTGIAEILEREDRDARIVVLGPLDAVCRSSRLRATGPYRRGELVDLVEQHGINVFLFPSIWPETFSYVVAELMAMKVPIVAFDLGAPAERLAQYPLGRLCREVSAAAALEALTAFHAELARTALPQVA